MLVIQWKKDVNKSEAREARRVVVGVGSNPENSTTSLALAGGISKVTNMDR
jgi:hypothetical protein